MGRRAGLAGFEPVAECRSAGTTDEIIVRLTVNGLSD
jgi:hypothetical protein